MEECKIYTIIIRLEMFYFEEKQMNMEILARGHIISKSF
jgi:hypothetical protein